jgi:hypothetical protein
MSIYEPNNIESYWEGGLFMSLLGPHLSSHLLGKVLGERIDKKHVGPFGTSFIISFVGPYLYKDKDCRIGSLRFIVPNNHR